MSNQLVSNAKICSRILVRLSICLLLASVAVPSAYAKKSPGGDFTLTDQNGNPFTLSQLRGRNVLIYFGYLNCPDICPIELNTIAQVIKQLGHDKVTGVFITLDPERDSQEDIGQYVKYFHPDIFGLTGSVANIDAVAKKYQIKYNVNKSEGTYTVDHPVHILIIDKHGEFKAISPFGAPASHVVEVLNNIK